MINNKRLQRRGVSPLVSTVLLVMLVIVLAIIILLWSRGFIKEAITKEVGGNKKAVDSFCLEVAGKMSQIINDDDSFGFSNNGNIPIFAYNLKLVESGSGSSEIVEISESVNPGFSTIVDDPRVELYSSYDSIKIIPVLLGLSESTKGTQPYPCPEVNGFVI